MSVFEKILTQGIRRGKIPALTKESRKWYRDVAKKTVTDTVKFVRDDKSRLRNRVEIGRMYAFYYDPKHKKTLPYYDRFPLIFPIGRYDDGFLGINLHYLPYPLRTRLMDALYSIASDQRYDEKTKLQISYEVLKAATKFAPFRPCIKRYLSKHVRSRFVRIDSSEWDIALFLPLESFEKASKQEVWRKSREQIKKYSVKAAATKAASRKTTKKKPSKKKTKG